MAAGGQGAFYATAVVGLLAAARGHRSKLARVLALPGYFCMVNAAALRAVWNLATGRRVERWETTRAAEPAAATEEHAVQR